MNTPKKRICLQSIAHLEKARHSLSLSLVQSRIDRLYAILLRPTALFVVCWVLLLLTVLFWAFGISFSLSAFLSFANIAIFVLWYMWRGQRGVDFSMFLADVARADECIADMEEPTLVHWPTSHPQLVLEEEISIEVLERWILLRTEQLQTWADTWVPLENDEESEMDDMQPLEEESSQELTFRDEFWLPPKLLAHKKGPAYRNDAFEHYEKE